MDSRTGEPISGHVTITKMLAGVLEETARISIVACPAKGKLETFASRLSVCLPACRVVSEAGPTVAALPVVGRLFRSSVTIEPQTLPQDVSES